MAKLSSRHPQGIVHDDPEQSQRFIDAARELETDESGEVLEHALQRILKAGPPERRTSFRVKKPKGRPRGRPPR